VSARERILARVRAAASGSRPHPGAFAAGSRDASWEAFAAALGTAAGSAHGPVPRERCAALVSALCAGWTDGGRIVASSAALAVLGSGPWTPVPVSAEPRLLADVSVAILVGATPVAENGAIALDGREARPRALHVLCEYLVLLVDPDELVADMHAALARMPPGALAQHHYTWVSGPSKTADIESTLVIGAHGPRALAAVGVHGLRGMR
jgi:L-lactate dehydrogenase complex protein LldG